MTQISNAEIISCKIFSELENFTQMEMPDLIYSDGTILPSFKMFKEDCTTCNLCLEARPLIKKRFVWSVKENVDVYLPLKICRSCYVESLDKYTIRLRAEYGAQIIDEGRQIAVVNI